MAINRPTLQSPKQAACPQANTSARGHLCKLSLCTLASLILFYTALVQGQSTAPPPPVVVTTTVEPWGFYDNDNLQTGILVDFMRTLMANAGLEMNNQLKPYPRVIHEIATGQAQMAVLFSGPQSDAIGQSLGKLTSVRIIIVTRASGQKRTSLEDFKGLRVGYVRGSKYGPIFDNDTSFTHIGVNDVDQGLRMLMSGRIDAMASTEHSLLFAMYQTGINSSDLRVALSPTTASAHLYVSRHALNATWLPAVQTAFNALRDSGRLKQALYKNAYWPYESFCFADGECLNAKTE